MIWPRASSSDAIAGVGSASVSGMVRRRRRRRQGTRISAGGGDEGSGAQTLGPFPPLTAPPVPVRSPAPRRHLGVSKNTATIQSVGFGYFGEYPEKRVRRRSPF